MNTNYNLPENITEILNANQENNGTYNELIRKGGYVPPHIDLLIDAISALSMGKNILLKGPTGAGKTKFAETLSNLFQQPMFSVNCSVDLDAESLMGFKTGYIGTVPLNEALKNRFIIIDVPYIEGEQLKQLIQTNTRVMHEPTIDLFVQLSADLINAVSQGKLSEDAASIRALLDACDLSVLIPPQRAILRSIVDKLEEEREKEFVKNIAETLF